ncbi:Serine/threonine-protein kinase pcrk1 [Orobanche gracilis]
MFTRQGHKEWVTEVNVLGVVKHPNLVKLIGYCAEDDERGIQRLLICEYMSNGSVENHLSISVTPLSWAMRLKIALDSARGLAYLHEEMDFQIIFRDFKSSNILLDEQWNAKLSDFGLARLGPAEGLTHVSTAEMVVVVMAATGVATAAVVVAATGLRRRWRWSVVGTMGYAAPEYIQMGRLTSKSDVWSFGVFLYELITGRRPLDRSRPRSEQKLLEWVKPYLSDARKFQLILDPRLEGKQILKSAHKLSLVANRCLSRLPKTRPTMGEVREMVSQVVETSMDGGPADHPQQHSKGKEGHQSFEESVGKGKRRLVDMKIGDGGWLVRAWTTKLVKTC